LIVPPSHPNSLTFEDAMAVHVLRAQGLIYSDLTCVFGANPARFHEILCGNLHPGSWEEAVARLTRGDSWHPEITRIVALRGNQAVLQLLIEANPSKKRLQRQLKHESRWSPSVSYQIRNNRLRQRK